MNEDCRENPDFMEWWAAMPDNCNVTDYIYGAWLASRKLALEECKAIADEMTQVPSGKWGEGAKYNAAKISRLISEKLAETI